MADHVARGIQRMKSGGSHRRLLDVPAAKRGDRLRPCAGDDAVELAAGTPGRRRRWRAWVVAVTLVSIVGATMLGLQRFVLFPRHLRTPMPSAGDDVQGLVRLHLETEQGRVEAWYLPGVGATAARPGPLVIFAHGNGELIDDWAHELVPYRQLGFGVLLPEYRGYGRSAGTPSEQGIVADFVRFHDRVLERPEVDPDRVVFHGRSLGGGVVAALARQRRPAALILQSTFTSVVDMAKRFFLPRFMVLDPFETIEVLPSLGVPVLVVHGRRDTLIPMSHAQALHWAAPGSELVLYDADHNDCPPRSAPFWSDLEGFLGRAGVLRGTRPSR